MGGAVTRADFHVVSPAPDQADGQALDRVAAGDLGGLGELYDRYAAGLYAFVRRFAPGEDAEDIVQTVFLRVVDRAASFDARHSTARPWLFGIATRVLRERRRSLLRLTRALVAYASEFRRPSDPSVEVRIDIEPGLARLSAPKRMALLLSEVEGFTSQEIAELLGVPIGTVWTRLHHARRELLVFFEDGEP
jgi:RNA polymerase sigma-70 factor (ECF subfamily)